MPQIFTDEQRAQIRGRLLTEGRKMMLERGITGMNIEELALSAGIAKGTFYNFFPSKQKFIIEISNDYTRRKLDELKKITAEKRGKLTIDEMLAWYKTLYLRSENPAFQYSRRDMEWIRRKIPPEELFQPELEIAMAREILSMMQDVREDIDYRIVANFPKMIGFAIENKDSMHAEVLDKNFDMIIGLMKSYILGNI